jgi:hypothetical protein
MAEPNRRRSDMDSFTEIALAERVRLALLSCIEGDAGFSELEEMIQSRPSCVLIVKRLLDTFALQLPEVNRKKATELFLVVFHLGRVFEREFSTKEVE